VRSARTCGMPAVLSSQPICAVPFNLPVRFLVPLTSTLRTDMISKKEFKVNAPCLFCDLTVY
jgi:hypothetical protein